VVDVAGQHSSAAEAELILRDFRRGWKAHPLKTSVQRAFFSKVFGRERKRIVAVLKGSGFKPRRKQSQIDSGFSRIRKKKR
jgi:hypothetical protein